MALTSGLHCNDILLIGELAPHEEPQILPAVKDRISSISQFLHGTLDIRGIALISAPKCLQYVNVNYSSLILEKAPNWMRAVVKVFSSI